MARVAAYVPDLLFGSNVLGLLRAADHDAALVGDEAALRAWLASRAGSGPRLLVVDLTDDGPARLELVGRLRAAGNLDGVRSIAFYSHVDVEVRRSAEAAEFDLVVPRSRFAREGAALIERVLT
ncbi:hypothetical protein [Conexibacter woesei]|uniref:Response regulator receiver protein n=1 Tax=Conexibacter woesei (strain DSM 14684 / CCUG 47730 / CIP 108061 / JCM 11494 / NBRC 100937 / ID131577) TaxID=469383 RepID=D3F5N5_CONWI|nr:hypothetical protein [Conexibacter woesei]ADB52584.1 hypothetical protein Cwoe_4169 [Conexibacter woesei DSM 14684]